MPQVINTNTSSMIGQKNLDRSQIDLQRSLERLSSGLRVNRAADDAAGLAIAATMTRQISGYEVALRNANDADSFLQVAEGGLDIVQGILIRMKELALQSANGSNSAGERANLDAEYQQLLQEIDRIVNTTTFNGEAILTGAADGSANLRTNTFQVDIAGANFNIDLTLYQANASNLGVDTDGDFTPGVQQISGNFNGADAREDILTFTIVEGGVTSYVNLDLDMNNNGAITDTTVTDLITSFNAAAGPGLSMQIDANQLQIVNNGAADVTISAGNDITFGGTTALASLSTPLTVTAGGGVGVVTTGGNAAGGDALATFTNTVTVSDGNVNTVVTVGNDLNTFMTNLQTDINAFAGISGVTVALDASNNISFQGLGANDISITTTNDLFFGGQLVLDSESPTEIGGGAILGTSVDTVANSIIAMTRLDGAITMVSTQRAVIGASQNRLGETIKNTASSILNISLSRARIMDADFAKETSNMSRGQILQQAGISILAQANQLPQNVLQLLQ